MIVKEIFEELTKDLDKREKTILDLRFGLSGKKKSLQEIGDGFGITKERVRQIQEKLLNKFYGKIEENKKVNKIFELVYELLTESNGFKSKNSLLNKLAQDLEIKEDEINYLRFFLIFAKGIEDILKDEFHEDFYSLKESKDKIEKFFHYISVKFKNKKYKWDDFKEIFSEEFYRLVKEKVADETIEEFLKISTHIWLNPFNEVGHVTSLFIAPKNAQDKIYALFKYLNKPLHFKELHDHLKKVSQKHHELIHRFWKNVPNASTIHNELIKSEKFVLVGRGLYALKEWDYSGLFVKDLILEILKKHKKPIPKETLKKMVLEKKLVKPETVTANLYQLKGKIKIHPEGLVSL